MAVSPDISGQRFGRLVVVRKIGPDAGRNMVWECACDCGERAEVRTHNLKGKTDRTAIRSCGCLQRETTALNNTSHGMTGTRLYNTWANMLARCENSKSTSFKHYGGRGITVCDEWHDFESFATWAAASGHQDALTIERKDNGGSYCPDNCRWATVLEQSRNKRPRIDQKLSDDQVAAIRRDGRLQRIIAAEYGVRQQHVSRIKGGKRRTFLTNPNEGKTP